MRLIDAIEAWGVEHRSDLTDAELRRLGTFWATLSNSEIGDRPVAFLTDEDADIAAALFTWTDKADVLELLDTVRSWHLHNVSDTQYGTQQGDTPSEASSPERDDAGHRFAPGEPPAPTSTVSTAAPAASRQPSRVDQDLLPADQLGHGFEPGVPLPGSTEPDLSGVASRVAGPGRDVPESNVSESGRDRGDTRLLQLGGLLLAAIVLVGVVITIGVDGDDATADQDVITEAASSIVPDESEQESPAPAPAPQVEPTAAPPDPTAEPVAEEVYPPLESLPEREAILRNGKLYLTGPVPNQQYIDAIVAKATQVMGAESVIDEYVIHPDAEPPIDGSVRIEQGVLFEADSATIRPEFLPILQLGVSLLQINPAVTMLIEGHTDSAGDPEYNRQLSLSRANAVADWISVNGSIDRARLEARGFGADMPIADNDSAEGKATNRRIEVQVFGLLSG